MSDTKISWADKSWNPVTGCSKIATGCAHCYAERMAKRLKAMRQHKYRNEFAVTCHPDALSEPLKWKRGKRVFVCSMSDLFHADVPTTYIDKVHATAALCPQHTFLFLTKRPSRMADYFSDNSVVFGQRRGYHRSWPAIIEMQNVYAQNGQWLTSPLWWQTGMAPPNVHLGTSCSTQADADKNIPELLRCPVAVRWLSLEPLLEAVDLRHMLPYDEDSEYLNHIVVGCESGPGRRPCKFEWIEYVIDQCDTAGWLVYVKQVEINGKVSTNPAEWPKHLRRQELPT